MEQSYAECVDAPAWRKEEVLQKELQRRCMQCMQGACFRSLQRLFGRSRVYEIKKENDAVVVNRVICGGVVEHFRVILSGKQWTPTPADGLCGSAVPAILEELEESRLDAIHTWEQYGRQ